jgi:hypothetical protein
MLSVIACRSWECPTNLRHRGTPQSVRPRSGATYIAVGGGHRNSALAHGYFIAASLGFGAGKVSYRTAGSIGYSFENEGSAGWLKSATFG